MNQDTPLRRALTDPMTTFVLIGAACYLLYALVAPGSPLSSDAADGGADAVSNRIEVDATVMAALTDDHLLLEGRAPDAEALDALLQRHIDNEILFREAIHRGLHISDVKTRHRLVDKMRFLLADAPPPPTQEQLLDYYLSNIDTYYSDWRVSFEQRFFAPATPIPAGALERLGADAEIAHDEFWLGDDFERYHGSMLRSIFGPASTRALIEAPEGVWFGPIESPRGRHLILVTAREAPHPIAFAQARERLATDWTQAQQNAGVARRLDALRGSYQITVER